MSTRGMGISRPARAASALPSHSVQGSAANPRCAARGAQGEGTHLVSALPLLVHALELAIELRLLLLEALLLDGRLLERQVHWSDPCQLASELVDRCARARGIRLAR